MLAAEIAGVGPGGAPAAAAPDAVARVAGCAAGAGAHTALPCECSLPSLPSSRNEVGDAGWDDAREAGKEDGASKWPRGPVPDVVGVMFVPAVVGVVAWRLPPLPAAEAVDGTEKGWDATVVVEVVENGTTEWPAATGPAAAADGVALSSFVSRFVGRRGGPAEPSSPETLCEPGASLLVRAAGVARVVPPVRLPRWGRSAEGGPCVADAAISAEPDAETIAVEDGVGEDDEEADDEEDEAAAAEAEGAPETPLAAVPERPTASRGAVGRPVGSDGGSVGTRGGPSARAMRRKWTPSSAMRYGLRRAHSSSHRMAKISHCATVRGRETHVHTHTHVCVYTQA